MKILLLVALLAASIATEAQDKALRMPEDGYRLFEAKNSGHMIAVVYHTIDYSLIMATTR